MRYEYTQASLSADFLKGIDAYVFNALEKIAIPELNFVLRFNKTKVIPNFYDQWECDHKEVFQGVFLVKHELAKRYFEIERESERQLTEENNGEFDKDSARSMHEELWEKQSREYLSLKEEVKASQDRYEIEWIVKREAGNPKEYCGRHDVNF